MMYLFGIDPAPSKTGLSVLSTDGPRFEKVWLVEQAPAPSNHFHTWLDRGKRMSDMIYGYYSHYYDRCNCNNPGGLCIRGTGQGEGLVTPTVKVVMEFPTPIGQFAGALHILDSLIINRLENTDVYLCSPTRIDSLVGKRATKGEQKRFFFEVIKQNNIAFPLEESKTKADISDSAILVLWVYYNLIKKLNIPAVYKNDMVKRWEHQFEQVSLESSFKDKNIRIFY